MVHEDAWLLTGEATISVAGGSVLSIESSDPAVALYGVPVDKTSSNDWVVSWLTVQIAEYVLVGWVLQYIACGDVRSSASLHLSNWRIANGLTCFFRP